MEGPLERYQRLGMRDMLSVSYKFPIACEELSCIIRHCYSELPKPARSAVFQDTLSAFRILPKMQTESAVLAADILLKSVKAKLRREKRNMAGKEFKQAMVAHKRNTKTQQEDIELIELPQDALLHLFSFLDMESLTTAGMVSRLWNAAASDNCLWKVHYTAYFEDSRASLFNRYHVSNLSIEGPTHSASSSAVDDGTPDNYKKAFRRKYRVSPWKELKHNRGYCGNCNSIVWLTNLKCTNTHAETRYGIQAIKPMGSSLQIVGFILHGHVPMIESSHSSDSDSDEGTSFKLWVFTHTQEIGGHQKRMVSGANTAG